MKSLKEHLNEALEPNDWNSGRFTFIYEYVKELADNNTYGSFDNDKKEYIDLMSDIYKDLIKMMKKDPRRGYKLAELAINGIAPVYSGIRFLYDLCEDKIARGELTKPREQKLNKILKEIDKCGVDIEELDWGISSDTDNIRMAYNAIMSGNASKLAAIQDLIGVKMF